MEIATAESGDLRNLLTGFLAAINESNKAFQSSVVAKINELQESNTKLQTSVESKLSKLQESVRADISSKIEKSIKRFEVENQKLGKEFSEKVDAESRRLVNIVGQVQTDTEIELMAVKKHVQAVSNGLQIKLDQTAIQNNALINQLTSKVIEKKTDADNDVLRLDQRVDQISNEVRQVKDSLNENVTVVQRRQRESIELISKKVNAEKSTNSRIEMQSAEIVTLKSKACEWGSVTQSEDPTVRRESGNIVQLSPSAICLGSNDNNGGNGRANTPCSCQSGNCNMCERNSMNAGHGDVAVGHSSAYTGLSNSEFPLPLFDDISEINPVFHLKQLDEFIRLKCIPEAYQLTVAYRSMTRHMMSKQWVRP
jgi:hypothetical protein